jgi:hypothetical protein
MIPLICDGGKVGSPDVICTGVGSQLVKSQLAVIQPENPFVLLTSAIVITNEGAVSAESRKIRPQLDGKITCSKRL